MSIEVTHYSPRRELCNIIQSFFVMEYNEKFERSDYLLPSGRSVLFYIETDKELYFEFEGMRRKSLVNTGFYLACVNRKVRYTHGKIRVVGASLHPIYLGLLFQVKPKDLINNFVSLDTIHITESDKLPLSIDGLKTLDTIHLIEKFMINKLQNNPLRTDVEQIYQRIVEAKSYAITVSDLAVWMGYSERHIVNIFNEYVGLSPKRFIQLTRFNQSLKLLDDLESFPKLSDVAYEMGYHDHAHFIRDFKQFCGKTPREIRAEKESAAYLFRKGRVD